MSASLLPMKAFCLLLLLAASPALATGETSPSAADLHRQAREAWSQRKSSPTPWLCRGRAYRAEGKKRRALKDFSKAVKVDPRSAEAYFERGRAFEELGKMDEAANEYQAALKADAGHAEARVAWDRLSARLTETNP